MQYIIINYYPLTIRNYLGIKNDGRCFSYKLLNKDTSITTLSEKLDHKISE